MREIAHHVNCRQCSSAVPIIILLQLLLVILNNNEAFVLISLLANFAEGFLLPLKLIVKVVFAFTAGKGILRRVIS